MTDGSITAQVLFCVIPSPCQLSAFKKREDFISTLLSLSVVQILHLSGLLWVSTMALTNTLPYTVIKSVICTIRMHVGFQHAKLLYTSKLL